MRVKLNHEPAWRGKETLYGLQENGETEGEKKDSIYQGSQYLCPVPSILVSRIDMLLIGELVSLKCGIVRNSGQEK